MADRVKADHGLQSVPSQAEAGAEKEHSKHLSLLTLSLPLNPTSAQYLSRTALRLSLF